MKNLKESILSNWNQTNESIISNTQIGQDALIKKFVDEYMKVSSKVYSIDKEQIQLWGTDAMHSMWVHDVPDYIHFNFFEPGEYFIYVDGDEQYKRFLNMFNCAIGSDSDHKRKKDIKIEIKNVKQTIHWNDFYFNIYGEVRFINCSHLDFAGGLPRISGTLLCDKCKVDKPYDLQNIEKLRF